MAFPFALLERPRWRMAGPQTSKTAGPANDPIREPEFASLRVVPGRAAFRRVASKGVYAGGGSIADGACPRKKCWMSRGVAKKNPSPVRATGE